MGLLENWSLVEELTLYHEPEQVRPVGLVTYCPLHYESGETKRAKYWYYQPTSKKKRRIYFLFTNENKLAYILSPSPLNYQTANKEFVSQGFVFCLNSLISIQNDYRAQNFLIAFKTVHSNQIICLTSTLSKLFILYHPRRTFCKESESKLKCLV